MTVAASGDGARALIDELHAVRNLPAACRAALQAVPREWFIPPRMWTQDADDASYQPVDLGQEPRRWLRAVYSNRVIVTQFGDGETTWPDVGDRPTCSASMPSAVVGMLAELDAQPGYAVLEIGTGTGWNAALLASIVGVQGKVTTIEVDSDVAADARIRLDANGYQQVETRVSDGAAADAAPSGLDRIIATAGVHIGRLPYSWVANTRPGGVILAPMRADMASGPLVRFVVNGDGTATGRAADMRVGFMELRS